MEEYKTSDYIAGIMEEIGCTVTAASAAPVLLQPCTPEPGKR